MNRLYHCTHWKRKAARGCTFSSDERAAEPFFFIQFLYFLVHLLLLLYFSNSLLQVSLLTTQQPFTARWPTLLVSVGKVELNKTNESLWIG